MTALLHEREVASRFDELRARFKPSVAADDFRLRAVRTALGPLEGIRILDLGCGKGRFAARLAEEGAEVVGIDVSAAMLAEAHGVARVLGSARRLPFGAGTFDAVVAVEVFEHLPDPNAVLHELRRVVRPGGMLAIVDKNAGALNVNRPWLPGAVVKRIDEARGRWMYPAGGPVRERWFWPARFAKEIGQRFGAVRTEFLLSREEGLRWVFRAMPRARLYTLWAARRGA